MKEGHLPCATYPLSGELLSSWITRLAHAHLLKAHTFGRLLFPSNSIWNRDIDKASPEVVLHTLAARTPASLSRIRETTLRSYEGKLYLSHNVNGNTDWILPLGIYHRTRRNSGLLFCPNCLRNDGVTPYFRKHWRLALSQVCTVCKVYLLDRCPSCKEPIVFFRVELGRKSALPDTPISYCFNCKFNLAEASSEIAPYPILIAQLEWERILNEGWKPQVIYPHLYFVVLHQLVKLLSSARPSCRPLQKIVVEQSGWQLPSAIEFDSSNRMPFELLSLVIRRQILLQAHWLLDEWPQRFVTLAKQCRVTSSTLLHDMHTIPFWYGSVVYEHLYVSNINRRFQ
jgi:hypothetical protein